MKLRLQRWWLKRLQRQLEAHWYSEKCWNCENGVICKYSVRMKKRIYG